MCVIRSDATGVIMNEQLALFIDSNVWLSMYACSSDNTIERFQTLLDMINEQVTLYMPSQVINEVDRNRENKFMKSMEVLSRHSKLSIPNCCKEFEAEYANFKDKQTNFNNAVDALAKITKGAFLKRELQADTIFDTAIKKGKNIDCATYQSKGVQRYALGKPPGKGGSNGDAVVWESLLGEIPAGTELIVITEDKDYASAMNKDMLNPFLAKEWESQKESPVTLYTNIARFLYDYTKDIGERAARRKGFLIDNLAESASFAETHAAIKPLSEYEHFSRKEIEELCTIFFENSQVRMIYEDYDVNEFYLKVLADVDIDSEKGDHVRFTYLRYHPHASVDD